MKVKDNYHIYALTTVLLWALPYVYTRLALQHFSVFSLGFLRYFAASCALILIVVIARIKPPKLRDLPLFAAAGATGFFLYMIFYNQGMARVTASTGSVIVSTVPVITALMARVVYKEALSALRWAAIAVELVGVIVLTLMDGVFSINSGLAWLMLGAVSLSTYNLLQRRLTTKYSALQTASYGIFFGTLMLTIFAPRAVGEVRTAAPIYFVYVAILGVLGSAIAYISWSKALSKAKQTSQVSNYMFVTPFAASILGFLLAGEVPDRATVLGGAIILFGVFVFNFGERIFAYAKKKRVRA